MSITSSGERNGRAFIGVDVGGTHTDAGAIIGRPGRTRQGSDRIRRLQPQHARRGQRRPALPRHFARGAPRAHTSLNQRHDRRHQRDHHSCAARASACWMTAGFRTCSGSRAAPALGEFDDHLQVNAPDLIVARRIIEVDERSSGRARCSSPIDAAEIQERPRAVVEDLGSRRPRDLLPLELRHGANEVAAEWLIRELYPDLFVSLLAPDVSGLRRDAALDDGGPQLLRPGRAPRPILDSLNEKLRKAGLKRRVGLLPGTRGRHRPRGGQGPFR